MTVKEEIEALIEIISEIRSTRNIFNIKPSTEMPLYLYVEKSTPESIYVCSKYIAQLQQMCKVSELILV